MHAYSSVITALGRYAKIHVAIVNKRSQVPYNTDMLSYTYMLHENLMVGIHLCYCDCECDFPCVTVFLTQFKMWLKPNAEQSFLYGNHVSKSGLGRVTENMPQYQGVVFYSMSDSPLV